MATHVTDACQPLVEQAAVTAVDAALSKGRAADQRSALARAQKVEDNTHHALHLALEVAHKRGEELEAVGGDPKEAQEGR